MLTFPNAKINLGLHVLRKRDDGYHDIETCLFPIPFTDVLEILPAKAFSFICTGLPVDGKRENNLCLKAYELIHSKYDIGPVSMHLHKVIPMGAGLGGGSSDAAFTLKVLNEIFEIGIESEKLKAMAAQLGSDCPVFIDNDSALASDTGTVLEKISVDLKGKYLLLAFPEIRISTQQAYSDVHPAVPETSLADSLKQPVSNWKQELFNDFERSVFPQYPKLAKIKNELYDSGAIYSAMSGSGSTIFALFEDKPNIPFSKIGFPQKIFEL